MKKNLATTIALANLFLLLSGGASFAAGLSSAEESYHDKVFDYVMDNVNAGQNFDWASYNGKGTIKAGQPFISKSKANCRDYTEDFQLQGSAGETKGVACRRTGNNGWCHLKSTDALTCAMERSGFTLGTDSYSVSIPSISVPNVGGTGGAGGGGSGSSSAGSGMGSPNFQTPDMASMNRNARNAANNTVNGQQPNTNNSHDGNNGGQASGTAYSVTNTLGTGAAEGTGAALGWFKDMFR